MNLSKKSNQNGFSVIEGILLIVILALIVGTGWYVWHVQQNTKKISEETAKQSQPTKRSYTPSYAKNSETGMTHYHNALGKFTFDYPSNWISMAQNDHNCQHKENRYVGVGPNSKSVENCGGGPKLSVSQVTVVSVKGDNTQSTAVVFLNGQQSGWTKLQQSAITVDGVKGMQYSGTAKGQTFFEDEYPDGSNVKMDVFYTNGNTYIAQYTQYPATSNLGPTMDETAAFDNIIDSLKFN
ncbi:MAG TPA: hypothetical protein VLG47_04885 [Candidatus Saccharimonadales bacterium]|nr:hypothetical protein [Candidatus Saccharimonadales bacterium]